jgi:large subunit ribosomal protein L4
MDRSLNPVGTVELDPRVFNAPVKVHLLHEVVVYQEAKHRRGTASTKRRGEVAGSNKKPWRQKGTGRARSGERRSPLWTGGGIVFGPKPRDYSFKVMKKVRKAALKSALSAKRQEEKLLVVDELKLDRIKTKDFAAWLSGLKISSKVLVVIAAADPAIETSARNLPRVKVLRADGINVRDVLNHERLVMTRDAALKIQEALA